MLIILILDKKMQFIQQNISVHKKLRFNTQLALSIKEKIFEIQ